MVFLNRCNRRAQQDILHLPDRHGPRSVLATRCRGGQYSKAKNLLYPVESQTGIELKTIHSFTIPARRRMHVGTNPREWCDRCQHRGMRSLWPIFKSHNRNTTPLALNVFIPCCHSGQIGAEIPRLHMTAGRRPASFMRTIRTPYRPPLCTTASRPAYGRCDADDVCCA